MTTPTAARAPQTIADTVRFGALLLLVLLSLFASGASSLVYQLAWFRELGVIFGVTVQATSAVLAAFMAGLAAGSFLAARVVPRLSNPFLAYGLIELGIGVTGFASLSALSALQPLSREIVQGMGDNPTGLALARFALAFAILLAPTTLMGATLPVLMTAPALREREHGTTVGLVYAANTFGAIAGALTAGFLLIGTYGITVTVLLAAAVNSMIGLVWLIVAGYTRRDGSSVTAVSAATESGRYSALLCWLVVISYALSGAVALAYEVVWTRLLSGIFPGSVYAFALMLGAILTGIAVGSWLIAPAMNRRANWPLLYVLLQFGMAFTALLSLQTIGRAYEIEAMVRGRLGGDTLLLSEPWFMAGFSLLAIGPVSLLMGMTFPVASRIYSVGQRDVGRHLGIIYGANVLGGLAGSLAGGLLLIPILGAQGAIGVLVSLNALAGALVLVAAPLSRGWPIAARVAVRVGLVALLIAVPTAAATTSTNYYETLFAHNPHGEELLWYREGPDVTVQIYRAATGWRALRINSLEQGSDAPGSLQFHYRLGHLPMLLHREPRDILMIGLGLGATAGAMAVHPESEMTLVELHHAVVEAADQFQSESYSVLQRPNVELVVNDGRNYLLLTNKRFDVIETDPIVPTNAGASFLYSADYFRLARNALNDGGFVVQWIDPDLPDVLYRLVLRTFLSVFPEATLWQQGAILIGSNRPIEIDPLMIERKLQDPAVREVLEENNLITAPDVLREFIAGPAALAQFAGAGPIITDRQPWIEYFRSQPTGRQLSDFTWMPAARQISAWKEPTDGVVTRHDDLLASIAEQSGLIIDHFTPGSHETLAAFVQDHRRAWVATRSGEELDQESYRFLTANGYLVSDEDLGHTRLRLFVFRAREPVLQSAAVDAPGLLRLTGVGIDDGRVDVGGTVLVSTRWSVQRALPGDLAIDLRLVDDRGRVTAAIRRLPLLPPGATWSAGTTALDRAGLRIPAGVPAGEYTIEMSLSTLTDGLPLLATAGGTLPLGRITVFDSGRSFTRDAVSAQRRTAVSFGGDLSLVGVTTPPWVVAAGVSEVQLYWQPERDGATREAVLLVGDPADPLAETELIAGDAGRRAGSIVRRDVALTLPANLPAGRLALWLKSGNQTTPIGTMEIRAR
ncbi:MAG: fused MFS/spermidine synthase [Dehalococcoidia bacterium]